MPIIADSAPQGNGGILKFADAVLEHPDKGVVVYNRVSTWSQAGKGKAKLIEKTDALVAEVRQLGGKGRLRRIVRAVEEGKLSEPRRALISACEDARKWRAIVVAGDLSRFLRAGDYNRRTNRNAWPTEHEFAALKHLARGAVLATVADPLMTEDERHSLATRRRGKQGRPLSAIPDKLLPAIFHELGLLYVRAGCQRQRWETPLETVAEMFNIHASAIRRAAKRNAPGSGFTWEQLALQKAEKRGLVRLTPDRRDIEQCL
jgi:hypothetical protein